MFTDLQIYKENFEFRLFILNDFYLQPKNFITFLTQSLILIFLQMVTFTMLLLRCPTLRKSTLKMTKLIRGCLTLFKSTSDSTLLNVVNPEVDVHNVASTLI